MFEYGGEIPFRARWHAQFVEYTHPQCARPSSGRDAPELHLIGWPTLHHAWDTGKRKRTSPASVVNASAQQRKHT